MNTRLSEALSQLFEFTAGGVGEPPVPDRVLIAEITGTGADHRGRPFVHRDRLCDADTYSTRFANLVESPFPWINVSYCGILDGAAVVTVECPSAPSEKPGCRPSVNFSGPSRAVQAAGWDARAGLAFR